MGWTCSGATGKDWMFSKGHSHAAESKSREEKAVVQEARPEGNSISPGTVGPWSTEELGAAHSQVQLGITADRGPGAQRSGIASRHICGGRAVDAPSCGVLPTSMVKKRHKNQKSHEDSSHEGPGLE